MRITTCVALSFLLSLCSIALGQAPQLAPAEATSNKPPNRPNILFIAVDDLRPELGCYGSPVKSPNLDALAARGMLFNRAYCQQALCSPSRTSLLTGRRPDTTKIYDLETSFRTTIPDVVTLPQYFMQNGYFAQSFGKIYHAGLNDAKSWSVPHTPAKTPNYGNPENLEMQKKDRQRLIAAGNPKATAKGPPWEMARCADNELPDGFSADHAIEALQQLKDKPFFLAVGFHKPHLPFVAPTRFFDLYPIESITLPPNPVAPKGAPEVASTNFAELRGYAGIPKTGPVSEQQAKELRRAYYASVSFMDSQVGRVIAELDKLGLRDNTIIILWGDHGWHLGDLGLWCKHTNFETATRAAMMISVPAMKHAGEKTNALTEYVDIYPTLCELAGLPLPEGLEGTSFAPVLNDPARAWKKAAFSQYPRPKDLMGYSMRTDRYRYTEWVKRDDHTSVTARELYDQQEDPQETINIAEQQPELVKQLSEQLRQGWKGAGPAL